MTLDASRVEISLVREPRQMEPGVVKDAIAIIRGTLNSAGYTGLWAAEPLEQIRSRAQALLRVSKFDHRAVYVKVKPGNNSTAWLWSLKPPLAVVPEHVYRHLRERVGTDEDDQSIQHSLPKVTKPAPAGDAQDGNRRDPAAKAKEPAPAAPSPAAKAATNGNGHTAAGASLQSLVTGMANLQTAAQAYLDRGRRLAAAEQESIKAGEAWERAEAAAKALREEHGSDAAGRNAMETLATFRQMLGEGKVSP